MIERKKYLDQLIEKKENGMVKVITGIRRCGKSYLLFKIYHQYLNSIGIENDRICEIALDDDENIQYRNPLELGKYVRSLIADSEQMHYVFLDEIQLVQKIKNPFINDDGDTISFVDVLLGLMKKPNVDLYVTGSNSKMLSSDILTEFRGRGDEVRVFPLSFSEYYAFYPGDQRDAWQDYFTYGGMPYILNLNGHNSKSRYLQGLYDKIYLDDILNRNKMLNDKSVLDDILDVVSSSIGSLTNPLNIANSLRSVKKLKISDDSVSRYLDFFIDAFLISKSKRYDIKGRRYIGSPLKYYYTDIGLRNVRVNFRQTEENHIMENIIFNELVIRGFSVDVGVVEYNFKNDEGKTQKTNLEIDFVASDGSRRYYIQSALTVGEETKRLQEVRPYSLVSDSFKKIIIVKDNIQPWYDENGILIIGIQQFLLNETDMDY